MANLCCSIELEPKTLKECQISQAREVAVEIVLNKESREAKSLIIQGMHPVGGVWEVVGRKNEEGGDLLCNEEKNGSRQITPIVTACQCSCPTPQIESPTYQSNQLKEPLSAHF